MTAPAFLLPFSSSATRSALRRISNGHRHRTSAFTATLLFPDTLDTPLSLVDRAGRDKLNDLIYSLDQAESPCRVWANYTTLVDAPVYNRLPLELHQQVLRHCTPSAAKLQVSAAHKLLENRRPHRPHAYENRFQTIVRNIRTIGEEPNLDDYHFILEQFAAVGHHVGALQVYQELMHSSVRIRPRTIALCLQALSYRLTLPIFKENRPRLIRQAQKILRDLTSDMRKSGIPFTPTIVDFSIRILRETLDYAGFENLMKWAYGVDLSNPDRISLEMTQIGSGSDNPEDTVSPLPFSTQALNTTIDMLGRLGNISKLVQTFEVLTQPMRHLDRYRFATFDEEEFGPVLDAQVPKTSLPPYAPANTTSYNLLLRHLAHANHSILCRHYLLEVMALDLATSRALRTRLWVKVPIEKILAPHVAVNKGHFISVFGYTNRNKDMALMRWLLVRAKVILRKKRSSLEYFAQVRDELAANGCLQTPRDDAAVDTSKIAPEAVRDSTPETTQQMNEVAGTHSDPTTKSDSWLTKRQRRSAFDPDYDVKPVVNPVKFFDLDLHISILERDIHDIDALTQTMEVVIARATEYLKERLGRRIWSGKAIYLSDAEGRVTVERDAWQGMVNFKGRKPSGYPDERTTPPDVAEKQSDTSPNGHT